MGSDTEIDVGLVAARFSDGASAGSQDVEVHFGTDGLVIRSGDGTVRKWPFASLTTQSPISKSAVDAIVNSSAETGATLFIPNAKAARRLADFAPHLSTNSVRWRTFVPLAGVAAAIALVIAGMYVADVSPARGIAMVLPDEARKSAGRSMVKSFSEDHRVCTRPQGRAALDALSERLGRGASGSTFTVTVLDWSLVNAFAVPGEHIVLTSGLFEKAGGPDEVAGVLAHEMAHGILRHPETAFVRGIGLSAAAQLLLGGDGGALANIGVLLAQLSYSRAAETEADHEGIRLLREAKISPQGLADFFGRMSELRLGKENTKRSKVFNRTVDLLSTHPALAERQAAARKTAKYPTEPSMTAADWSALRDICKAS